MKKTRRQILTGLGVVGASTLIGGPWELFIDAVAKGLVSKAEGASASSPRNYIHIEMFGAPARWVFDVPVKLFADDPFNPNRMVKTHFISLPGHQMDFVYDVVPTPYRDPQNSKIYQMPWQWKFDVPSVGGSRPMMDLLKHMLIIRGIDLEIDGHFSNFAKQSQPNALAPSLDGYVTDHSERLMPNVRMNSKGTFRSKKGLSPIRILAEEPLLTTLTAPFRPQGLTNYGAGREEIIERVLRNMQTQSTSQAPWMANFHSDRVKARKLIRGGLNEAITVFPQLKAKYEDLIFRSIQGTNLSGLTDAEYFTMTPASPNPFGTERDVASELSYRVSHTQLMAPLFANSTIGFMADYFAMTEFLITRGLTHSVVFDPGTLSATIQNGFQLAAKPTPFSGSFFLNNDQHVTGEFSSVLMNSLFFRALSSCLLEFIQVLKTRNIWKETVVHVTGEFSRSPRNIDGGGSDHGFKGHSVSILSGAINNFKVVGNIYQEPPADIAGTQYTGTWGVAAPIHYKYGQPLDGPLKIGNVTSTLAHLLRVEKPTPNDQSVVVESGEDVNSTLEAPKVIG